MTNRIAVRGSTQTTTGSTTLTVSIPAGTQVGELVLVGVSSAGYQPGTPVGWTLEASVSTGTPGAANCVAIYVYSRVAQAGDPTLVSFSGLTADYAVGLAITLIGQNPTTYIDATPSTNITTPASQTYTLSDLTTTTDNTWLVGFIASDADASSSRITAALTNGTVIEETLQRGASTTAGTGGQLFVQTAQLAVAGATGALTRTEATIASISVSVQVPIRPAADTILRTYQDSTRIVRSFNGPTNLRVWQSNVKVVRSTATVAPPAQERPTIVICM